MDQVMDSAFSSEHTESDTDTTDEEQLATSESESSDTSDGEDTGNTEAAGWISRCGGIQWAPTNRHTARYVPAATRTGHGPTRYAIVRTSSLVDAFNLYFTDEIMKLVTDYTNLQGRHSVPGWRDLDQTDLQAYIGLLLLAGVYRSRDESMRSLWDGHSGRAIFRATMSQASFKLISTCLRFDDRLSRPQLGRENRLAAVSELWEMWNARLPLLFNPATDVCVGEMLVPFRGHSSLRQFVSKKPAKYGIKLWVTCDVKTSYAWRMQIYTGTQPGTPTERNQGKQVVLDMTEGLRGVTVTVDHVFTSFALAEALLRRKVALLGTVRRNKPELPPELLQLRERAALSSVFAFTRTHTAVSYMPKQGKNVLLLSTRHREAAVSSGEKRKPLMIKDYDCCKGAVDNLEKVCATVLMYVAHIVYHLTFLVYVHDEKEHFNSLFFIFLFRLSAPTPAGGGQISGPRCSFTTSWT